MPLSDGIPSTPPGPSASLEESLRYYKAQYEVLESELADFQASSKELEAELEKDIDASEKREQKLKDKATNLQYEVDEWKTKHKQAKSEATTAQNVLQKEITELRDTNRTLQLRLRDIEVANDDFERKQRNTESSLEDMESRYNQTIERSVMLEEEMKTGEQEREALRIEAQRLKDELSDLKIETDIVKEKLHNAELAIARRSNALSIEPPALSASPRSELSPTTTDASFDTPPAKTSSSGISDTPTPPSPPISEKSVPSAKSFVTPSIPKTRASLNGNIPTPRQPSYSSSRPPTTQSPHKRGPSVPAISRTGPSSTYRQSITNNHKPISTPGRGKLPQSSSIMHLRNLRSKMQNLEVRVQTARSKLPAPVSTPPRGSPRSGSTMGNHASVTPTPLSTSTTLIPSSVTVRSKKRNTGSAISGPASLPDSEGAENTTAPSIARQQPSRQSLTSQYQYSHAPRPPPTPNRPRSQHGEMPAPPSRPDSRTSRASNIYSHHSRPGSRASISGFPRPNSTVGYTPLPNASTDRVRPKSSLSNHGYDGTYDDRDDESILEGDESVLEDDNFVRPSSSASNSKDFTTPTPRRTTFSKRTSDVGSAIPTPANKRASITGSSRLPSLHLARRQSQQGLSDITPNLARRQSQHSFTTADGATPTPNAARRQSGIGMANDGMMGPPTRTLTLRKRDEVVGAGGDANETF
jgi:NUDE protein, C-terminal conserved region